MPVDPYAMQANERMEENREKVKKASEVRDFGDEKVDPTVNDWDNTQQDNYWRDQYPAPSVPSTDDSSNAQESVDTDKLREFAKNVERLMEPLNQIRTDLTGVKTHSGGFAHGRQVDQDIAKVVSGLTTFLDAAIAKGNDAASRVKSMASSYEAAEDSAKQNSGTMGSQLGESAVSGLAGAVTQAATQAGQADRVAGAITQAATQAGAAGRVAGAVTEAAKAGQETVPAQLRERSTDTVPAQLRETTDGTVPAQLRQTAPVETVPAQLRETTDGTVPAQLRETTDGTVPAERRETTGVDAATAAGVAGIATQAAVQAGTADRVAGAVTQAATQLGTTQPAQLRETTDESVPAQLRQTAPVETVPAQLRETTDESVPAQLRQTAPVETVPAQLRETTGA